MEIQKMVAYCEIDPFQVLIKHTTEPYDVPSCWISVLEHECG